MRSHQRAQSADKNLALPKATDIQPACRPLNNAIVREDPDTHSIRDPALLPASPENPKEKLEAKTDAFCFLQKTRSMDE
jgi:hypothetical protein